jgi:integrase
VYLGQDDQGRQRYWWVGRFATRSERNDAVAEARTSRPWEQQPDSVLPTVGAYVDDVLERMDAGVLLTKQKRPFKRSSRDAARGRLGQLARSELGDLPLDEVSRHVAIRWAETVSPGVVNDTVVLFNRAVDEELLERNPFRGLGRKIVGRADSDPPTEEQMILLLEACSALGDAYAFRMRALIIVAAYTIMRPGELFALDWERDVDLEAGEIHVIERVYEGELDLPKSNRVRTIALLPQAREALLSLPEREGLVFRSKRGKRLSQPTMSWYWSQVLARARLDFDFYLATKHYGVHHLKVRLGLPNHDIAEQAGWSEKAVEEMVRTYAHTSMGALERIKRAAEPDIPDAIPDAEAA